MQITSAFRPNVTVRSAPTPPPQKGPEEPKDGFHRSEVWQAAKVVGASALNGAMEGIGYSYLGLLASAIPNHMASLAVKGGLLGLGAAVAVKERSGQYQQILGSEFWGKAAAGVAGAGRVMLMMGSPTTPEGAMIQGGLMGGMLGVLDTPR